MSLGLSNTTGGPTLDSQIIAESKGSFGSLTFGGSDTSKYVPSNVSFTLAPDVARDLVVGIQSITSTYGNGSVSSLLPSPTLAFIDSTVPYIYLPEDACKTFESELGLVYNKEKNIYFVDDALHQTLLTLKPSFTFRLGNDKLSKPTVEITLPYASFDLAMKPPLRPNTTSYFPLRRGADDQITLGRAFLQEAYVITDYDRKNFTVAQAIFNEDSKTNIVPIPWNAMAALDNATAAPGDATRLSRQTIIGIGTGSTFFFFITATIIFFCVMRRRKHRTSVVSATTSRSQSPPDVRPLSFIETQELGHRSVPELHDIAHHLELLDGHAPSGSGNEINELPNGDEVSWRELSAPATSNSNLLSSRGRSTSPTHTTDQESHPLGVYDKQASTTKNPPSNIDVGRTTLTQSHMSVGQTSAKRGARSPSDAQPGVHIDKALPLLPTQRIHRRYDDSLHPTPPVTPISESFQVSSAFYTIPRIKGRNHPGDVSPKMSPLATYSTIFDVEEYRDSTALIGVEINRQLDALTKDGQSPEISGSTEKRRATKRDLAT
ncbi:MAG: hypothetical protein Q9207_005288 [Kuettlingeria erythrocarpa]